MVVVDKVASLPLAVVISFCSVAFLFGLNEVARDIEDPFTTTLGWTFGANRLDAPLLQAYFDERLLSIASLAGDDLREWPEGPRRYGPFLSMAIGSKAVAEISIASLSHQTAINVRTAMVALPELVRNAVPPSDPMY